MNEENQLIRVLHQRVERDFNPLSAFATGVFIVAALVFIVCIILIVGSLKSFNNELTLACRANHQPRVYQVTLDKVVISCPSKVRAK